ncbi:alpha/beta hydrolase family esterase [Oceanidesulfovibrio marinus]|nr:dienelactone hydrolase family protein [Oceanidesulfovibrio marinus]
MRLLILGLALACAAFLAVGGCSVQEPLVGDGGEDANVDRVDGREVMVWRPASSGPHPTIVFLHGSGWEPADVERITGLPSHATYEGYLVLAPRGTGPEGGATWNAGNCCDPALSEGVDDVQFIKDALNHYYDTGEARQGKVFLVGFGAGGKMVYQAACGGTKWLAGMAVVGGTLESPGCNPAEALPLMVIHGLKDESAPYFGGPVPNPWDGRQRVDNSVLRSTAYWGKLANCDVEPSRDSGEGWVEDRFDMCQDDLVVSLLTVTEGGHAWPGGRQVEPDAPQPSRRPDATARILEFFSAYR